MGRARGAGRAARRTTVIDLGETATPEDVEEAREAYWALRRSLYRWVPVRQLDIYLSPWAYALLAPVFRSGYDADLHADPRLVRTEMRMQVVK